MSLLDRGQKDLSCKGIIALLQRIIYITNQLCCKISYDFPSVDLVSPVVLGAHLGNLIWNSIKFIFLQNGFDLRPRGVV
jgi:hypothetical protein